LQYSDSIIPFSFSSESEEILVASNKSLKNNNEELIRGVGNYYHFLQSVYIYVYKGILYTDKLTQEIDLFINSLDVETGKVKKFMSMIDAMNYMGDRGWEFIQAYAITYNNQNVYHYILKRPKKGSGYIPDTK